MQRWPHCLESDILPTTQKSETCSPRIGVTSEESFYMDRGQQSISSRACLKVILEHNNKIEAYYLEKWGETFYFDNFK
jgi:hypothetical protein